jgi:hypothetical protein
MAFPNSGKFTQDELKHFGPGDSQEERTVQGIVDVNLRKAVVESYSSFERKYQFCSPIY